MPSLVSGILIYALVEAGLQEVPAGNNGKETRRRLAGFHRPGPEVAHISPLASLLM